MQISFILVEPAVPENVGAAARAMKTMGFNKLILINPCDHLSKKAHMLAHASHEILEHAQVFGSFQELVHDFDFIIGTSAKRRSVKFEHHPVAELVSIFNQKKGAVLNIALVFGREESGLTNDELHACDLITYIPLATEFPSLNLGQAVMLYAYELAKIFPEESPLVEEIRNQDSYKTLKIKTEGQLQKLKFESGSAIYNRILERVAQLSNTDINLLHSIIAKLERITE